MPPDQAAASSDPEGRRFRFEVRADGAVPSRCFGGERSCGRKIRLNSQADKKRYKPQ
jgi:hypothetical protein